MAGENTVTTADGLFKDVFAKKLIKAVPNYAILQDRITFNFSEKGIGLKYNQPVSLSHEAGFSYLGKDGAVSALKTAKNGVIQNAEVEAYEMLLRAQMANTFITRAAEKGEKAFEKSLSLKVFDMNAAFRKRLEISMLYGQSGIGTLETVTDLTGGVGELVITAATWAGGIWAGAEGARIDSFTSTTKNNASGVATVTKVDCENRKLTVSHSGTFSSEFAVGDVIFFEGTNNGSSSFNEMAGLAKIIANTTTLFGIDAATYSLWKGTTVSGDGVLTFNKLQGYVAKAVNKGLMEKCVVLVSPKGWTALANDMSALRMLDSSYSSKKAENGAESLLFHSQNGALEVVVHPFVKDGDMFVLPLDAVQRIGSCDVTFGLPGGDEKYFTWLPEYNAVEMRCMADQAIFLDRPAQAVYVSGITY